MLPCMCWEPPSGIWVSIRTSFSWLMSMTTKGERLGFSTAYQGRLVGWASEILLSPLIHIPSIIYIYREMQASLYCRTNHESNATTIWEWYVFDRYSNLDQTRVWNWIWYDSMDSTWIYKFDPIRSSHKSLFHWSCPNGSKSLSVAKKQQQKEEFSETLQLDLTYP